MLQHAVTSAEQLSEEEGGLLVESNKGCAAELEAADAARAALAMLLCQAGGGRSADAAPHLKALGFKFRLADEVRMELGECMTKRFWCLSNSTAPHVAAHVCVGKLLV